MIHGAAFRQYGLNFTVVGDDDGEHFAYFVDGEFRMGGYFAGEAFMQVMHDIAFGHIEPTWIDEESKAYLPELREIHAGDEERWF